MKTAFLCFAILCQVLILNFATDACSILYYQDLRTGRIYAVSNEDYWYDVNPLIRIEPRTEKEYARLWYGWNGFAQGGINEHGLFFDGAVAPEQTLPQGYNNKIKGNLGNEILAHCKTVNEAIDFMEQQKIALTDAHIIFGDKTGNAVVAEWINGKRKLVYINDNYLAVTNFLLADTTLGNYPCNRYNAMVADINRIRQNNEPVDLKRVGNIVAKAVQVPKKDENGRTGGTLYSTFIDITTMKFKLVYKLDNSKLYQLDLNKEFSESKKRTIKLE